jgi:hypothetical protein
MRIYEFTNAEEQLGLLRLIIDNTWSAIQTQANQQKAQRIAQASKVKPKAKSKPKLIPRPSTVFPSIPKTVQAPTKQTVKPIANNQTQKGFVAKQNMRLSKGDVATKDAELSVPKLGSAT